MTPPDQFHVVDMKPRPSPLAVCPSACLEQRVRSVTFGYPRHVPSLLTASDGLVLRGNYEFSRRSFLNNVKKHLAGSGHATATHRALRRTKSDMFPRFPVKDLLDGVVVNTMSARERSYSGAGSAGGQDVHDIAFAQLGVPSP